MGLAGKRGPQESTLGRSVWGCQGRNRQGEDARAPGETGTVEGRQTGMSKPGRATWDDDEPCGGQGHPMAGRVCSGAGGGIFPLIFSPFPLFSPFHLPPWPPAFHPTSLTHADRLAGRLAGGRRKDRVGGRWVLVAVGRAWSVVCGRSWARPVGGQGRLPRRPGRPVAGASDRVTPRVGSALELGPPWV